MCKLIKNKNTLENVHWRLIFKIRYPVLPFADENDLCKLFKENILVDEVDNAVGKENDNNIG